MRYGLFVFKPVCKSAEEQLVEQTKRTIELFAPRLILGISDELSSTGNIERVRLVGQIVDDYNASVS